jgi:hypothetical protein
MGLNVSAPGSYAPDGFVARAMHERSMSTRLEDVRDVAQGCRGHPAKNSADRAGFRPLAPDPFPTSE